MIKGKKSKSTASVVVYCGPTIPGVVKKFTIYNNGIPESLTREIGQQTAIEEMIVPLEQLPETMKQLRNEFGHRYRLYQLLQAYYQKGGIKDGL